MTTKLTLEGLACPAGVEKRGVCGVVTVAAAAGITFDQAWALLSCFYGPRWGGRTYAHHRHHVLAALGVRLTEERRLTQGKRRTLKTLVRFLKPGVRYIIETTGHVQIVKDGIVLDQAGPRPVNDGWAERKRVQSVHSIVE